MRPGRLDRILYIPPPDQHARYLFKRALLSPSSYSPCAETFFFVLVEVTYNYRLQILQIHTAKMKFSEEVNLERFSEKTEGYSGAEIVQVKFFLLFSLTKNGRCAKKRQCTPCECLLTPLA
jgi:hypothetical protein